MKGSEGGGAIRLLWNNTCSDSRLQLSYAAKVAEVQLRVGGATLQCSSSSGRKLLLPWCRSRPKCNDQPSAARRTLIAVLSEGCFVNEPLRRLPLSQWEPSVSTLIKLGTDLIVPTWGPAESFLLALVGDLVPWFIFTSELLQSSFHFNSFPMTEIHFGDFFL